MGCRGVHKEYATVNILNQKPDTACGGPVPGSLDVTFYIEGLGGKGQGENLELPALARIEDVRLTLPTPRPPLPGPPPGRPWP